MEKFLKVIIIFGIIILGLFLFQNTNMLHKEGGFWADYNNTEQTIAENNVTNKITVELPSEKDKSVSITVVRRYNVS